MEDAATAEISRAQVWQWLRHGASTNTGQLIDLAYYKFLLADEIQKIKQLVGEERYGKGKFFDAIELFDKLVTQENFDYFLTTDAYDILLEQEQVEQENQ